MMTVGSSRIINIMTTTTVSITGNAFLVAAMCDVPDVTRQEWRCGSRHRFFF